ncbi:MAG: hypothetical protein KAZ87_11735 [Spirochaetes bacterium]|nr:hypothetical protein [Spirochaetota bacterium]
MNSKIAFKTVVTGVSGLIMVSAFSYLQILFNKCQITASQYLQAWTSFSVVKIENLNRYLVEKNTIGTYIYAHYIDFIFFISFGVFFYLLFTAVAVKISSRGKLSFIYRIFAYFALCETLFDFIETTLVLYSTDAGNPVPGWVPFVHDPANYIKFIFFYAVIIWGIFSILFILYYFVRKGITFACKL